MSNVYTIGVRMTMDAHGVSAVLRTLAHEFVGIHHHISNATAALGAFRTAVVGAGAAFAGFGIAKGLAAAVEHGNNLVRVQQQMTMQGWREKELAEATAKAYELSTGKFKSLGVVELLKMQKEMAPVLGDRHHAVEMTEQMASLMVSFQGAFGVESASKFHTQVRDAIRAGELSANVLDPERFATYLDGMAKTLKAFGGTITPSDYFMATKYGRAGAINWSDDFTNNILPTIMQELGASSTGTALMTMYQAVVGGRMKARSINAFDELGLIDRSKLNVDEDLTPEGRIKRLQPNAFKGSRLFMENPFEYMWEYIVPAMIEKGVVSQKGIDEIKKGNIKEGVGKEARKAITEQLAIMFGDRTAQGMADLLVLQYKKIMRDKQLINQAFGLDQGVDFLQEKSLDVATVAFKEQWENLITTLGAPSVGIAVEALHRINEVLSGFTQYAAANPEMMTNIFQGLAAFAAGLIGLGSAAVMGALLSLAGPGGILFAIVTALGALAALNWDGVKKALVGEGERVDKKGGFHAREKSWFEKEIAGPTRNFNNKVSKWLKNSIVDPIGKAMDDFGTDVLSGKFMGRISAAMTNLANAIGTGIASIPGKVMGAIQGMASAIAAAINSAIAGIAGMIGLGSGTVPNPGGGKFGPGFAPQKQSFVPPGGGGAKPIQIKSEINMDGRKVAEQISFHVGRASRQVQSAAGFDGIRGPTPVDFQYI